MTSDQAKAMPANKRKTPDLGPNTKILSFDIESNGLHGEAFAIAALVMKTDGTVTSEFLGRSPIKKPIDSWVAEKVIPMLEDFPQTHANAKAMRMAFWDWYLEQEPETDYVLINNGYPVEYRFLLQCQEDNLADRYWQHPFPMLDLSSLLLQIGIKTTADKRAFTAELVGDKTIASHNPYWDTWLATVTAFKALKVAGQL